MQKPGFITCLFLCCFSLLNAQSEKQQSGLAISFTGALIPISQPGLGIQPGLEYRFNNRIGLLAELTIAANKKNSKDSSELDKKYFRIKSELRYSFLTKRKNMHQYAGLQITSSRRSFINQNSFYFDNKHVDSVYYYDRAYINSPVATVSLQFGSIITKGKFATDIFAGIGVRFINTKLRNVENPVRGIINRGIEGPHFTASYSYSGNITMFHFNAGIRLMWHFYEYHHPKKL
jgi:hypothetical protein